MNKDHLTVVEMEALLSHMGAPERSMHLQGCEVCAEELEALRDVMGNLRTTVIASAEAHRQLAMMPTPVHRTPRAMWSMVAATVLLCVAGPVALHRKPAHLAVVQAPATRVEAAVSDEQLMSDVQQDLSSSVPQVMLPLTAKDASDGATGATSNVKENE